MEPSYCSFFRLIDSPIITEGEEELHEIEGASMCNGRVHWQPHLQLVLCEMDRNFKKMMTLKPRILNSQVEIMDPSIQMSTVHKNNIVESPFSAAHSSAVRRRSRSGRKKYRKAEWTRGRDRGRELECDIQKDQWHSWSWFHFSANVGFISQEAKLVFIGSLGVRDVWVNWEERGTTKGGKYMVCQQTARTNNSLVP